MQGLSRHEDRTEEHKRHDPGRDSGLEAAQPEPKEAVLARLRARIERIEKPEVKLDEPDRAALPQGEKGLAQALSALPSGLLHEIYAPARRAGGAALGFALGLARGLMRPARPALLYLQLSGDAQELGLPYGSGIAHFGLDPDQVIIGRMGDIKDLLWAVEEAVACRAVAAVLADLANPHKGLDFTASRRLSLRAAAAGISVFILRYGAEREASAAKLRWRLTPHLSGERPFDARAPAGPRWEVELEKGRLGRHKAGAMEFIDWTENGFERAGIADDRKGTLPHPPLSGAEPSALGHRLSQAG